MVFGLFSRRKEQSGEDVQQLRTPSPSVDSSSIGKNYSPKFAQDPPASPSPPPPDATSTGNDQDLGLIDDPKALHALISNVPPKVLHDYILSHLIPPTNRRGQQLNNNIVPPTARTLTHLTSFFSSLTPPPKQHCVRCHKDYFDVDNDDRSCLVAHDDESAEVERVGLNKGSSHQTLWGCCGQTVEGDGDMGPPDGWCYEGKHTTDPKRARFRADSTIHDDKLLSCQRARCNDPSSSDDTSSEISVSAPRPRKKRNPKVPPLPSPAAAAPADTTEAEAAAEAAAGTDHEQDDEVRSATSSKGKRKAPTATGNKAPKRKRPRKSTTDDKPYRQPKDEEETESDVEMEDATTKRKPRARKPRPKPVKADEQQRTPSPTRSAAGGPGSPGRKSALASSSGPSGLNHKKSGVAFSSTATTVEAAGTKGVVALSKGPEDPTKPRRPKKVMEVISSSIDGETW